jgi:GTPase SAR1 family protein
MKMFLIAGAQRVHTLLPSSIMDPSKFKLRKKFERFRILIIGRANAGKTTILQKVCKAREIPEIFNSTGEKVRNMIPVVLGWR